MTTRRLLLATTLAIPGLFGPASAGWFLHAEDLPVLKIGIDGDYPPYSFMNADRSASGLDVELATEACRRLKLKPEFVPIAWDQKATLFAEGKIHCIWSSFTMTGREKEYLWVPYLYSRQVIVTRRDSGILTKSDLDGRVMAVQSSTRPEAYILKNEPGAPALANMLTFPTMSEAFVALRRRLADATAGHEAVMKRFIQEVPGDYRILDEALVAVQVGVAFPLNFGDPSLVKRLGTVIEAMTREGFVAAAADRWGLDGKRVALNATKC